MVKFQGGAGNTEGYLSASKAGGPGVLVIHAWWGLNPFFKVFCQRLANEGFVVLAPDLYHGKVAESIEEAKRLRSKVDTIRVMRELEMATDQLLSVAGVRGKKLGLVGFSLGGY